MDCFSACLWACFFRVRSLPWTRQTKSNFSKSFDISSKTWLFEDFFNASVSSRTVYCFFLLTSTSTRSFISVFVHTSSFFDFLGFTNHNVTCPLSWIDSLLKTAAGFLKWGVVFVDSSSSSRIYTLRRIIHLDELSTMVRLTRRTIADYSVYFWLIRSFTDPAFIGSIFVCVPLHHHVLLFSFLGAVGRFKSDMLFIFYMVWSWFSCGTVCVCPQLPYRGNDMIIWIFPVVPCHAFCMWHWPTGEDLDLSFIWGHHHPYKYMNISRPTEYFIACYTVLTRSNKVETAVHGCNCWLSVCTLSCRCPVKLFT